jgi:hypothetical protein
VEMTSEPGFPSLRLLLPLTVANGAAVATLYVGQSVVARAVGDFGPSATISLMPGATLAGYAAGVAGLATLSGDLTEPRAMRRHFLFLVAALCAAAAAPTASVLTAACFLIGVGCALTQRLLACAASTEYRARTIGWIIAGGLLGILLARACVPAAAGLMGWRGVFWVDAVLTCGFGFAAARIAARVHLSSPGTRGAAMSGAASLWRGEAPLREAALQQALVFAIFNMGWAVFPLVLHGAGTASALAMAASPCWAPVPRLPPGGCAADRARPPLRAWALWRSPSPAWPSCWG